MDIGAWLRQLGLERYEEAFRDNEIDAEILPKLTADDLNGLGVTIVGHRRRMLEALAALPLPNAPHGSASASSAAAVDRGRAPAADRDVRRPGRLDRAVGAARSRGHARGDPRLPERGRGRDRALRGPRRQVHGRRRAGLFRLAAGARGRGRAGGAGRAGDRGGDRAAERPRRARRWPRGSASRPASWWSATWSARVRRRSRRWSATRRTLRRACKALAAPGQVVIADATRRLLGAGFELEDLGAHELKGIAEPVAAFAVTGERPVESRFEAHERPALLPMVGRDQELALLLERWAQAKAGEGQGVLLVGEAGIGKSRISPRAARRPGRGAALSHPLPVLALPHRQRALAGDPAAEPCGGPGRGRPARRPGSTSWRRCSTGRADASAAPLIADLLGLDGRAALRRARSDAAAAAGADAGGAGRAAARAGRHDSRCWWSSRTPTGSTRPRSS